MLSLAPPFGAVGGAGGTTPAAGTDALVAAAAGAGRALAGGGAWLCTFWVVLGACADAAAAGMLPWLGELACGDACVTTFGSEPRPGGGGGFDGVTAGGLDGDATRIDPD
jgi:hypothetical protein